MKSVASLFADKMQLRVVTRAAIQHMCSNLHAAGYFKGQVHCGSKFEYPRGRVKQNL